MTRPLVIIGPTASGKTKLGLDIAQKVDAEIISADAMAVYKEMSVGTAKPSEEEQALVKHHLIDVVSVTEEFELSTFQQLVNEALADIVSRNKTPIMVGGTGLYVRCVVDDLEIPPADPKVRDELDRNFETPELWEKLVAADKAAADKIEPNNRRRILRALEVIEISGRPFSSFGPGMDVYQETKYCQVGLEIDRDLMDERIEQRFWKQVEDGFIEEVRALAAYELSVTASKALGYAELAQHIAGELTVEEAIEQATIRTRRFARRQQRWFRRDPRIKWFDPTDPELVDKVYEYWGGEP